MKKILLLAFALIAADQAYSQSIYDDNIDFYGVDFSMAKAFGADERFYDFIIAFERINFIMISEAKKYNVCRYFSKKNVEIMLDAGIEASRNTTESDFFTYDIRHNIDDAAMADHIRSLNIDPVNSTGMIILCELLNKPVAVGFWRVVFFDTSTKEITGWKSIAGKAEGSGLRNFWANSIYNAFRTWSYVGMQTPD